MRPIEPNIFIIEHPKYDVRHKKTIVGHQQPIVGSDIFILEPYLSRISSNIETFNVKL